MAEHNGFPHRMGRGMILVAALLMLGLLTWVFDGALDRQRNPNQSVNAENLGNVRQVVLEANRQDHYVATAEMNGEPVEVLVDTGATQVAVSQAVARRLDLPLGAAGRVSTANGTVQVRMTRLDSIRLGTIEVRGVDAIIVPNMDEPEVLLGMNFLRELEMTHRQGQLILKQYAR